MVRARKRDSRIERIRVPISTSPSVNRSARTMRRISRALIVNRRSPSRLGLNSVAALMNVVPSGVRRTCQVGLPLRVFDRGHPLLLRRADGGLETVELVVVEPAPVALGAAVDLDVVVELGRELDVVARTLQGLPSS